MSEMSDYSARLKLARLRFPGPEEALKRLGELGEMMLQQDNFCTDQPLFAVQVERTEYGLEDDYAEGFAYFNQSGEEVSHDYEARGQDDEDDEGGPREVRRVGIRPRWEIDQIFLTSAGAEEYIRINGHNLGKTRVYAIGSFRNGDMRDVRNALMVLAAEQGAAFPHSPGECDMKKSWEVYEGELDELRAFHRTTMQQRGNCPDAARTAQERLQDFRKEVRTALQLGPVWSGVSASDEFLIKCVKDLREEELRREEEMRQLRDLQAQCSEYAHFREEVYAALGSPSSLTSSSVIGMVRCVKLLSTSDSARKESDPVLTWVATSTGVHIAELNGLRFTVEREAAARWVARLHVTAAVRSFIACSDAKAWCEGVATALARGGAP